MNILYAVFIKPIELFIAFIFENLVRLGMGFGPALMLLSLIVTAFTAPFYYLAERWKNQEAAIQQKMAKDLASIKAHYNGQKRFYLIKNAHRLHGYGPLSPLRASLGILIQIPFFFAPYLYLSHFPGYVGTSFLFLSDLGRPDALLWGINVLPFAMTAVNVTASMLYTKNSSAKDTFQLLALALLFLVVLYDSPSALLLYWTMNNVFAIPKNAVMARLAPKAQPESVGPVAEEGKQLSLSAAMRKYLSQADRPLLAFALTTLLLGIQVYWQLHFERSFKYAILITALAGLVASFVFAMRCIRRFSSSPKAPLIALIVQWVLFGVSAYLLFFARRQNAYISNQNVKLLTVLTQDAIIFTAITGFLSRTAGAVKTERSNERAPQHRMRLFGFTLAFLLAYLFILSPTLVYFSSPRDIGMGLWELILRNAAAAALLLLLALGLFRLLGERAQVRAIAGVVAVVLLVLVYNYVIPGNYGILDELHLEKDYLLEDPRLATFLLDFAVIVASVAAAGAILRKRATAIVPTIGVLTAIFTVQLTVSALKSDWSTFSAETTAEAEGLPAESEAIHRFSKNGVNILLVVADMFNGNYIDRLIQEYPEYREKLDGFTWYSNTLAISSTTVTSMPSILAGYKYAPEAMNEIPGKGYDKYEGAVRDFVDVMIAQGFDSSIMDLSYMDLPALSQKYQGKLRTSSSNSYIGYWKKTTGYAAKEGVGSGKNRLLVMVTLFQSAPVMLKSAIYDNGSWLIFRKSYQLRKMAEKTAKLYAHLDLLSELSSTADQGNTFKLLHTQFTHEPFGVTRQGSIIQNEFPDPKTGTKSFVDGNGAFNSAKKMIDFMLDWTDWMKRNGIYDNTFIVVMSDHGNNALDSGLTLPPGLDNPLSRWEISKASALLMVKRLGASGSLKIDDRFLSNADAAPMLRCAAGDTTSLGRDPTVGPIEAGKAHTYSRYYGNWSDFMGSDQATLSTYVVKDDMHVSENWSKK